jgi:hypothetical protein
MLKYNKYIYLLKEDFMKKKILLISLMVAILACLFAISVSARTDYRE